VTGAARLDQQIIDPIGKGELMDVTEGRLSAV
jgi:hypothetical protein